MSGDNLHDDAEFERFLAGDDELSRQLKGLAQAEPSAELDAAVFARIEAAMAAEKVQTVEPAPAANDPIGPPAVPLQRRKSLARSLAYYWHWPVGVAAGILAVLAYRTAFEPYNPRQVALNDTNMRVIIPTPHVTEPADVTTEPGRLAAAPAVIEPPDVAPQPAPPAMAAAPAPAVAAAASAKEAAAPTAPAHVDAMGSGPVVVTASNIRRADAESASPVQVITSEDLRKSGTETVHEVAKKQDRDEAEQSGIAKAWGYDPTQIARAARAKPAEPLLASAAAPAPAPTVMPPPPPPAAARSVVPNSPVEAAQASEGFAAAKPSSTGVALPPPPAADIAAAPALQNRYSVLNAPAAPAASYSSPPVAAGGNFENGLVSRRAASPLALDSGTSAVKKQSELADASEEQRKKQLQPAASEKMHASPRKWLALIEQDIKNKRDKDALAEWDKFTAAYPSYKVKDKLRATIESLRTQLQAQPASAK